MRLFALVEGRDHVCCRYRLRAFIPALADAGHQIEIHGLPKSAVGRLWQFSVASTRDVVFVQRRLLPAWQARWLRRASRRLVYDFDDALYHRDSYDRRGIKDPVRARRFGTMVSLADSVLAGNELLAEEAVRRGATPGNVAVIPTNVDPAKYPMAVHGPRPGGLTLVWIGSSSTVAGLARERQMFDEIARACPGLRLKVICDAFPDLGALPILVTRWTEAGEAGELAASDVGISWVPGDSWSEGKCGLKIIQYQAAGLPTIANPVGVHRSMIKSGETGFLVDSGAGFVDSIRRLAADDSLRARMGEAGREHVEKRFSVAAWQKRFVSAVMGDSGHALS